MLLWSPGSLLYWLVLVTCSHAALGPSLCEFSCPPSSLWPPLDVSIQAAALSLTQPFTAVTKRAPVPHCGLSASHNLQ